VTTWESALMRPNRIFMSILGDVRESISFPLMGKVEGRGDIESHSHPYLSLPLSKGEGARSLGSARGACQLLCGLTNLRQLTTVYSFQFRHRRRNGAVKAALDGERFFGAAEHLFCGQVIDHVAHENFVEQR
jgi:hypothetical protein